MKKHTAQSPKGNPVMLEHPPRNRILRRPAAPPIIEQVRKQLDSDHDADGQSQEDKVFAELLAKYQSACCAFGEFCKLPITPREPLLGKWFKEGDTGFVFGQRGAGKTWFADLVMTHLTTGADVDEEWPVPSPLPVLLVDGEMAWDDTKARLSGLGADPHRLHILHHEVLFEKTGLAMDLANPKLQRIVTELCLDKGVKLLVLETLSSLFRNVDENKSDAWREKVLPWFLELRRRRIAVLLVLHAGWNPEHPRGDSSREDDVFWVIKVKELDREPHEAGAKFETSFTKWRNVDRKPEPRLWLVKTEADGTVTYKSEEQPLDDRVFCLIKDGVNTARAIAEELNVDKSTVTRAIKRIEDRKLIQPRGSGKNTYYEARGVMRNDPDDSC